jgi:hypothetical protein
MPRLAAVALLLVAARALGEATCAADGTCGPSDEENSALLQRSAAKKLSSGASGAGRKTVREQEYPLAFQFWGPTGLTSLRVLVTAQIGSESYQMTLDTGSATVALCNKTYNETTPAMPSGDPVVGSGSTMCEMYGAGGHGYWGKAYEGEDIRLGVLSAPAVYVVMQEAEQEVGNACGVPGQDVSIGAETMQGIFGFVASPGFNRFCVHEVNSSNFNTCNCNANPDNYITRESAFQALLNESGSQQFAISWSSGFGRNSGTLYTADAASLMLSQRASSGVTVHMPWVTMGNSAGYTTNVTSTSAFVGDELLEGSDAAVDCANSNEASCIVDTGSPAITLPNATCEALKKHFLNSEEPATVKMQLAGPGNSTVALEFFVPQWMMGVAGPGKLNIVHCGGRPTGMLGLVTWIWFQDVHFDIGNDQITFVPRENLSEFLDYLRPIAERLATPSVTA